MRLEPLYVLRFRYPESFHAGDERLLLAEGEARGRVTGRFRVVAGAVRNREVVLEVAELVWEPVGE